MTQTLTVVSYNIRLGVESSLAAVATAVAAGGVPDVLALQEVGDRWNMGEPVDQARVIADRLGLPHAYFAGALTDTDGGRYGIALCARFALDEPRVTALPRAEDEQRVMLEAVLRHPAGAIALLTSHLSILEPERIRQAQALGGAAARAAGRMPTVLLGDLNDRPGTATVEAARGPLVDAFAAVGEGPAETFSVRDPHRCIDYVFCGGGLMPHTAEVDRAATASDHFPLRTRLLRARASG